MKEYQLQIKIRDFKDKDESFIYNSFLKCNRNQNANKALSNDIYYKKYKAVVAFALKNYKIKIACHPDFEDQIYGYIIYGNQEIFFAYTKYTFRMLGIFDRLVMDCLDCNSGIVLRVFTRGADSIREKYKLKYNPFMEDL